MGGWMTPLDPRSRIALYMNWKGKTVPVLLRGLSDGAAPPTIEEIQAISPPTQIRTGTYRTPTFVIHGALDDLIPVEQVQSTCRELATAGVEVELRVVEDGLHLLDLLPDFEDNRQAVQAVVEGYGFLSRHVVFQ